MKRLAQSSSSKSAAAFARSVATFARTWRGVAKIRRASPAPLHFLARAATAFTLSTATAADLAPDPNDPATELASFRLAEGFEANLFASEKDGVVKPIQIRWDARGRLWVIGSTTYPQIKPGEVPNDKVLILEDTDGDGRADKTSVFADGLEIPTGLEVVSAGQLPAVIPSEAEGPRSHANALNAQNTQSNSLRDPLPASHDERSIRDPSASLGITGSVPPIGTPLFPKGAACYVGEGSKLLLLTDTDGDGKADKREVVLRGFGTGDNHQCINSFRWSPGGELLFSQGLHAFSRVETAHGIVALDQAGFFRFRPRKGRLDAFYGGSAEPQNPWGFAWTDWGQMLMVAGNNGGIYYPLPEMIRGVQGGRRDQIWENARGRKCSGPDIIGTAHLPPEWQGVMLSGGYINNAVWALQIADDGAGFKVTDRPPLVTSTHTSFRPVDVKIGPDGAIYLCDWYNPIIGHYQASFRHPDRDKTHGRIWRITAKGRPLVKPPRIADAPLPELFEHLKSPERWVREQTRRELAGRETGEVVKGLDAWIEREMPLRFEQPSARLPRQIPPTEAESKGLYEALGVYESLDAPNQTVLDRLSKSVNANARAYATNSIARWPDQVFGATYYADEASADANARVRLAGIVAAANIANEGSFLNALVAVNPDRDRFIELAARSTIAVHKPTWERLLANDAARFKPEWLERLAALQRPPGSTKPAPAAAKVAPAPIPATGTLRATPEFVAALVKEVREKGDAKRGAEVFRRAELACVSCHSIEDKGGKIGPPLDAIGSGQPLDFIIGTVLEPQREIKESYEAMQLTLKDGRTSAGYIVQRDATATTLRDPASGGEQRFPAAEIAETKSIGSFMPAGLVDRLSREELRDLFRYLSELGKPR